jgi:hypothetical protein
MDSTIYIELIKQAPYIAALIVLVGIFIWDGNRREASRSQSDRDMENLRTKNATELEDRREKHEREINNMWANSIKMLIDQQDKAHQVMMSAIKEHDRASQERYDRIGITNDLIQAVKDRQQNK